MGVNMKIIKYMIMLVILVSLIPVSSASDFNIPIPSPTKLTIPTYDGSGQAVHPDMIYFPNGWHGHKYWMAFTPYPYLDNTKENPSIVVSNDGKTNWVVPYGVTNPIDQKPVGKGANSDTELVYNEKSDQLELYYVESGDGNSMLRRRKFNGVKWSSEQTSMITPDYNIMSPAIVKNANTYDMWYTASKSCRLNSGVKYTNSNDGLSFSSSQNVNIYKNNININKDINVWHINVEYIPTRDEYWMVYAGYPVGSDCGKTDIYFAQSSDKINYVTDGIKLLPRTSFYSMNEYRSAFLFDETTNIMKLWMSGMDWNRVSRIGYSEIPITTEPTVSPTPASSPTATVTSTPPPASIYSLVMIGTSSNYYVELISKVSNVKVLFYVDNVLYRTETIARYCLFGGDIICKQGILSNGQHIIVARIYDKTTGVLKDTRSITIGQTTPAPTPNPTVTYVPGPYSLVKVGNFIPYYVELVSKTQVIKVVFYVDGALYRTETIWRYCLFGGDICAPGKLATNGQHTITAKIYDKYSGLLLDTQSIVINQ